MKSHEVGREAESGWRVASGTIAGLAALFALYIGWLAFEDVPRNHMIRDPSVPLSVLVVGASAVVVCAALVWMRPRRGWFYLSLATSAFLLLWSLVLGCV